MRRLNCILIGVAVGAGLGHGWMVLDYTIQRPVWPATALTIAIALAMVILLEVAVDKDDVVRKLLTRWWRLSRQRRRPKLPRARVL